MADYEYASSLAPFVSDRVVERQPLPSSFRRPDVDPNPIIAALMREPSVPNPADPPAWAREGIIGALRPFLDAGQWLGGVMAGNVQPTLGDAVTNLGNVALSTVGPNLGGIAAGATKFAPAIFAGPLARTADREALRLAQTMERHSLDPEYIWNSTGWFQGADKKWRFEIPDDALKVRSGQEPGFGSVISHPELSAAYPKLPVKQTTADTAAADVSGSYGPRGLDVAAPTPTQAKSVAAHEAQHAVQKAEGFARGGSPEMSGIVKRVRAQPADIRDEVAMDLYNRLAGEVESRNVQRRLGMTPAERRVTPPWMTEDVPPQDQILAHEKWWSLGKKVLRSPVDDNPLSALINR